LAADDGMSFTTGPPPCEKNCSMKCTTSQKGCKP
jgi:hypothetical protein